MHAQVAPADGGAEEHGPGELREDLYKRVPYGLLRKSLAGERKGDSKNWYDQFHQLVELCNMEVEVLKQGGWAVARLREGLKGGEGGEGESARGRGERHLLDARTRTHARLPGCNATQRADSSFACRSTADDICLRPQQPSSSFPFVPKRGTAP